MAVAANELTRLEQNGWNMIDFLPLIRHLPPLKQLFRKSVLFWKKIPPKSKITVL